MRVLMLSKACIVGIYQRKLEEMAAQCPELQLTVCVPPYWRDERGRTPLERAHTNGYQLKVLPMWLNGQYHLHFYPTFHKILAEAQPDIVHIDEEPYNFATYHANVLSRRRGAKTLWFSWQNLNRSYPLPFAWFERHNLRHTNYALAGSPSAAAVWRTKGYEGPLQVIPQFGVDPDIFAPPEKRSSDPVVIAYAGRLVPEKGVDVFLRALDGLAGDWRGIVLGSGPQGPELQALCNDLSLREHVTFQPSIPSTAMPDFYRGIDILVLPSRRRENWVEQFGRALIEAMACGAAVVGAATGEIPYVIGEAGIVFPEDDAAALRASLQRLMDDPEQRRAFAAAGRERVLAQFTQARIAQATLAVYQEMLA